MQDRRGFLQTLSAVPFLGSLIPNASAAAPSGDGQRDYFKELGIRPVINAAGTYTSLTGSLMLPEVLDAINYASKNYVQLTELQDKVGERIATLLKCEAAMVTAGCASALTLATAGVLTGTNRSFIQQLPDLAGMKSEVLIQRSHRFGYDHAVRNCGIRMIEVDTVAELERAINPETAMMLFLNSANDRGQIKDEEWVRLGRKHGVPTLNDCAADVPPVSNLFKYTKMGFDLVAFSGGKGIRGPQSAGLLLGRQDLIAAARLNHFPHADSLGRGMKVNKEELLGMMVAVESYLSRDHDQEWKDWENRAARIVEAAQTVPGVKAEIYVPEIANHVPHISVSWDPARVKRTKEEVVRALAEGDPAVAVMTNQNGLQVGVWMLKPGEHEIVARRIQEELARG